MTRLRRLRQASGLSQRQVARRIGVDTTVIWRIERDAAPVPVELRASLADLFGVSVAHLMGWDDDEGGPRLHLVR
jgi:transcriptional regulator with XRE-family HTH domain